MTSSSEPFFSSARARLALASLCCALLALGCDRLGNPDATRTSTAPVIWEGRSIRLTTEARSGRPPAIVNAARRLPEALVQFIDPHTPPRGGVLTLVRVKLETDVLLPPGPVLLLTEFDLGDRRIRRVWTSNSQLPVAYAIFAMPSTPSRVATALAGP